MLSVLRAWWFAELTTRQQLVTTVVVAASSSAFVTLAAWLLTHGWDTNWDAVAALASTAAAIIAVAASVAALRAPQRQQAQDRSDATREVLHVTRDAVELYEKAREPSHTMPMAKAESLRPQAARARHIRRTLDRLLNRQILTDGAIITGEGAITLMDAIISHDAQYSEHGRTEKDARFVNYLDAVSPVEKLVVERAAKVAEYAVRERWPAFEKRFTKIAKKGLMFSEPRSS